MHRDTQASRAAAQQRASGLKWRDDHPNYATAPLNRIPSLDEEDHSAQYAEDTVRLASPLETMERNIAQLTGRLLRATDELNMHSNRVQGSEPGPGNSIGKGEPETKPESALDRIDEGLASLECAVIYLEIQVKRACVLA